jgi:hypothetical protein
VLIGGEFVRVAVDVLVKNGISVSVTVGVVVSVDVEVGVIVAVSVGLVVTNVVFSTAVLSMLMVGDG